MIASLNVRATSGNKLICAAENNAFLLLIVFCIVFLFGTISRAAKQFLINDEIFTHYVMSLGSLREIWVALSARADGNPPLSYLIEAATTSALSDNLITFRLPSILGFLAFSLCLYVFVSRRTTRLQGLLAAIIPSISEAYFVAHEARPYALVLGCTGVLLVCWQMAAEGRARQRSLTAIACAYAAAISLHYYSVLLVLPFAVAATVRLAQRRKPDLGIWLAFVIGGLALLAWTPLILGLTADIDSFWSKPNLYSIPSFYQKLLAPFIVPQVISLVLLSLYKIGSGRLLPSGPPASGSIDNIPLSEKLLAVGFLLYPVGIGVIAYTVTNAFHNRYPVPAIAGIAILIAYIPSYFCSERRQHLSALLVFPALTWFAAISLLAGKGLVSDSPNLFRQTELPLSDLPVVVSDDHIFLQTLLLWPPRPRASTYVSLVRQSKSAHCSVGALTHLQLRGFH